MENGEHLDPYNVTRHNTTTQRHSSGVGFEGFFCDFGSFVDFVTCLFPSSSWLQVPEQLIGIVGLAGPKGETGKKGPQPQDARIFQGLRTGDQQAVLIGISRWMWLQV